MEESNAPGREPLVITNPSFEHCLCQTLGWNDQPVVDEQLLYAQSLGAGEGDGGGEDVHPGQRDGGYNLWSLASSDPY